jgi:hypothetical protein
MGNAICSQESVQRVAYRLFFCLAHFGTYQKVRYKVKGKNLKPYTLFLNLLHHINDIVRGDNCASGMSHQKGRCLAAGMSLDFKMYLAEVYLYG